MPGLSLPKVMTMTHTHAIKGDRNQRTWTISMQGLSSRAGRAGVNRGRRQAQIPRHFLAQGVVPMLGTKKSGCPRFLYTVWEARKKLPGIGKTKVLLPSAGSTIMVRCRTLNAFSAWVTIKTKLNAPSHLRNPARGRPKTQAPHRHPIKRQPQMFPLQMIMDW